MCVSSHNIYFSMQSKQSKRCRIRRLKLTTRMRNTRPSGEGFGGGGGQEMIVKNLKLFIENMSILEENRRLRKKASLLHQENLELMSEIQKKFPSPSHHHQQTVSTKL